MLLVPYLFSRVGIPTPPGATTGTCTCTCLLDVDPGDLYNATVTELKIEIGVLLISPTSSAYSGYSPAGLRPDSSAEKVLGRRSPCHLRGGIDNDVNGED